MTTITLDQITAAAATIADTPEEQGAAMAAIILELSKPVATPAKPARKAKPAVDPTIGTGAALKANWNGQMMKSAAATATSGQIKRLVSKGVKAATAKKLSMVEASNRYAALTGRI